MHLHLFIPELLWPEPLDSELFSSLELPALSWLIAHSRESACPPISAEAALVAHFLPDLTNPPYAALTLLGETDIPPQGRWLCANPVHLNLTQERLVLADASRFDLSNHETNTLIATLNQEFHGRIEFCALHPNRWYLRLADPVHFATPPLSQVAGRRLTALLPEDASCSGLRQLLTEIQMILHAHPVNQAREANGHMTINSLWLWGEGAMPENIAVPFDRILGNYPLLTGCARGAGITHGALPDNAGQLGRPEQPAHNRVLVAVDTLVEASQYEDGLLWRERMLALETHWFAPIKATLGKNIRSLTLESPTIYGRFCWRVQNIDRWRFWQRTSNLAELIGRLASKESG